MTYLTSPFKSPRSTINFGLHSGAASGNLGLVKFALDNGQPVDSLLKGLLPIHVACAGGHVQVVKYLLERGADVNSRRRHRRSSGSLLSRTDNFGPTPLHFAASNGSFELVLLLLSWGAKVAVVDKYGSTPLSVAIAKNHLDIVLLLQKTSTSLTSTSLPSLLFCKSTASSVCSDTSSDFSLDDHSSLNYSSLQNLPLELTPDALDSDVIPESHFMTSFSSLLNKKGFNELRASFSELCQTNDIKQNSFKSLAKRVQKSSSLTAISGCSSLRASLFSNSPVHTIS